MTISSFANGPGYGLDVLRHLDLKDLLSFEVGDNAESQKNELIHLVITFRVESWVRRRGNCFFGFPLCPKEKGRWDSSHRNRQHIASPHSEMLLQEISKEQLRPVQLGCCTFCRAEVIMHALKTFTTQSLDPCVILKCGYRTAFHSVGRFSSLKVIQSYAPEALHYFPNT